MTFPLEPTSLRHRLHAQILPSAFAIVFGVTLTLAIRGYQFGGSNHNVYLIDALHQASGGKLLARDWFTTQTLQYHALFGLLTRVLYRAGVVEPVFLIGQLLLIFLMHLGWFRLVIRLGGTRMTYLISVLLFYVLAGGLGLGVYEFMQDQAFLPSNIANVAMLWGLYCWIARKPACSGLWLGVAGLFHLNHAIVAIGLWIGLVGWEWLGARYKQAAGSGQQAVANEQAAGSGRQAEISPIASTAYRSSDTPLLLPAARCPLPALLTGSLLVLGISLTNILIAASAVLSQPRPLPFDQFVKLYVELRHSHHYDPTSWPLALWICFLLPIPPAIYAGWRRLRSIHAGPPTSNPLPRVLSSSSLPNSLPTLEIGPDDNLSDDGNRPPSPAYSRERVGERADRRPGKTLTPTLSRRTGRGGKSPPQQEQLRLEENRVTTRLAREGGGEGTGAGQQSPLPNPPPGHRERECSEDFAWQQSARIFALFSFITIVALIGAGFWFVSEPLVKLSFYRFSIYLKLFSCIATAWLLYNAGIWDRRFIRLALLALPVILGATIIGLILGWRQGSPAVDFLAGFVWRHRGVAGLAVILFAVLAVYELIYARPWQRRWHDLLHAGGIVAMALVLFFAWGRWLNIQTLPADQAVYLRMCQWVKDNTPEDALFLVPPEEQSFRLHAQRAIIVNFKGVPQLNAELVVWRDRLQDVLDLDDLTVLQGKNLYDTLDNISIRYRQSLPDHLIAVADKYDAEYLLTESPIKNPRATLLHTDNNDQLTYYLYHLTRRPVYSLQRVAFPTRANSIFNPSAIRPKSPSPIANGGIITITSPNGLKMIP